MPVSSYSSKMYGRIQAKNKKNIVTVDSLYENKTYKATEKIANAIRELRSEGLITIKSILDCHQRRLCGTHGGERNFEERVRGRLRGGIF
jgi:hypothetical protein